MSDSRFPPFRAVLRNAATWGAAWAAAGGAIVATLALLGPGPGVESLVERVGMAALSGVAWGVRFGIAGAAMGTVFSLVVSFRYRGRRLADIDPVRFALLGTLVGGVGVPLYLQTMNVLSGDGPIAWHLVLDDAPWAAVFGAVAAAGSILLARRANARPGAASPGGLDRADDVDALPAAESRAIGLPARERAARR